MSHHHLSKKFDFSLSLNDEERITKESRYSSYFYKELGPQMELSNFLLPAFKDIKYEGYELSGDGIEIGTLEFNKKQMDVDDYVYSGKVDERDDQSTDLLGSDITIRDFVLIIPI